MALRNAARPWTQRERYNFAIGYIQPTAESIQINPTVITVTEQVGEEEIVCPHLSSVLSDTLPEGLQD